MTTYDFIINKLKEEELFKEFYRFQGGDSFEYYNIKNNCFDDINDHYIYFSSTKNHHYYFTIRRIRQLINAVILKDSPYIISNKQLKEEKRFQRICNLVINSGYIRKLNSVSLICDRNYYNLLRENSVSSEMKNGKKLIERVDRRVYGGGFGIVEEWLDLFEDLTLFSSNLRITDSDLEKLLENMKRKGKLTNPLLIEKILEEKNRKYVIKDSVFNDFHKYNIMNDLELICEKGLCVDSSELNKMPSQTIKKILSSYQQNREKVLRLVDEGYKKY